MGSANFFTGAIGGARTRVGNVNLNDFALQNIGDSFVKNTIDVALGIVDGLPNDWTMSGAN